MENMKRVQYPKPRDEIDSGYAKPGMNHVAPATDSATYDVMDCEELRPCGHAFRRSHMEALSDGEIYPHELGERVVNPKADTE